MARRHRPHENWDFIRDVILFFGGLIGVFVELFSGEVNPSLLIIFAAMLGLPITLQRGGKNGH